MRRSISLFTFLSLLSVPLVAQDKGRTGLPHRETVQVSVNGSDAKFLNHPTFALFAGAPRELYSHDSERTPAINSPANGSWKIGITATVFWVGEPPIGDDPGNLVSAWDPNWLERARGQSPFYVALPYNDVSNGHTKPEARNIIPWFKQAYVRDGQSVLKDHWVVIRKGTRICYAQWEDVGPFQVDHWQYVFGNERPRPNRNRDAGIDVSPAVKEYLGMSGTDACDWRFASDDEITPGPWKMRDAGRSLTRVSAKRAIGSLVQASSM
jgi:hypothetical protein